jgi:hypothetical protein
MAWHFPDEDDPSTLKQHLYAIENISLRSAEFWRQAHGWAPNSAAELLAESRLDWLSSFAATLKLRVEEVTAHPSEPAVLIVAWAHLRTLVEGQLKLFLCVFLEDYLADTDAPKNKQDSIIAPDGLLYDRIKQYLIKSGLLTQHHTFIGLVQQRGNAIHAFAHRDIGTAADFLSAISVYRRFLEDVDDTLPTPDSM